MTASEGVEITGPAGDRYDEILTPEALGLIAALHREFGPRRAELLAARAARQEELSAGAMLDFLPGTRPVREDRSWRVAPPAPGLVDRRVEITGPTERKMTINALNSGANVWLADFEDANTPLWENMITGQLNLMDALDRTIDFTSEEGKSYRLRPDDELATIVVRPARLAPGREAPAGGRPAGVRQPVRLRAVLPPLRPAPAGAGLRAVLLPAQDREPPGGAALERRVQPGPGRAGHPRAARSGPRC